MPERAIETLYAMAIDYDNPAIGHKYMDLYNRQTFRTRYECVFADLYWGCSSFVCAQQIHAYDTIS